MSNSLKLAVSKVLLIDSSKLSKDEKRAFDELEKQYGDEKKSSVSMNRMKSGKFYHAKLQRLESLLPLGSRLESLGEIRTNPDRASIIAVLEEMLDRVSRIERDEIDVGLDGEEIKKS